MDVEQPIRTAAELAQLEDRINSLEAYTDYLYSKIIELETYCGIGKTITEEFIEDNEIMEKPKLNRTQKIRWNNE